MVRKPIERSLDYFYHVTARSNNKDYFYLPIETLWGIYSNRLAELQKSQSIDIAAFVLMHNHFHLMLRTPSADIDKVMYFLMKQTTIDIQKQSGRINKIYGGRYKGSIIKNEDYLYNVIKYIYLNPVKAGIVQKAETYPFSTLFYKFNNELQLQFQITKSLEVLNELSWINSGFSEKENKSIKTGLRKSVFEFGKEKSSGKAIVPNGELFL
ncbi:MAG: hypothetical protein COW00_00955 [Bdellovibrio sp. CG12_big_fil_rev_8_21_14_0_65_39_13]|nr:MAG: hypothetical protein COW00_00955 [Bdellovibrio sp. CG12_big_fil_rev_8_21_14_0_65_39_13]PIR36045.1 MAG: hypothetical protein COV37_05175 [Bdellovibrio sp. CG11_big_fil_rev_8_21_14_0_20_39_38]PJB53484.1 MAG: hypothetical protein CO099_06800 [Bdellovibrio sp. CG_4_9_14_3_um_filter_39_7]